jgi:hypothetical protein
MNNKTPIASRIFNIVASYGFAVVILAFLLILTLFGTLEQADYGLYAVQKKYFDSLFLVHSLFGFLPIPLPGVYLLLTLLFINLVCGAIIRAPKYWRYPGMLIAHCGILLLLAGGFVNFHFATYGSLQLYEKEASNRFHSYHDWVVEIRQTKPELSESVFVIPAGDLAACRNARTFRSGQLPFELELSGYTPNCAPRRSDNSPAVTAVDGFYLQSLPLDKTAEMNIPGVYADVREVTGDIQQGILWGLERAPLIIRSGLSEWAIGIQRQSMPLPFTVVLDDFTVEHYPNTKIPHVFRSEITKVEGRTNEKIKISMNKPLRYRGYTVFQASWGPENAPPGTRLFSGFAIVRNPADHWPLYACIVVGVGIGIHFIQKLLVYLLSSRSFMRGATREAGA